jgi:peptidoglycan/xylan/chitin deacetylase (PgdA/CDA1 family)
MTSPSFEVLPWNGYRAALSLTFDDGDASQLDIAVPELEKRNLRGTFYLIAGRLVRPEDWKKVIASGQEAGNHSLNHKHARDLVPGEEQNQVAEGKRALESLLGVPIPSFAYPFTEITPGLRKSVEVSHLLARGGEGEYYMRPDQTPDWFYLPSQVAFSQTAFEVYQGWADQSVAQGAWTIPQLHAFEGTATGWQPLSRKTLNLFLDHLVERRKELWIAPLGEVGTYWLAQKAVEKSKKVEAKGKTSWTWKKPTFFPTNLVLKIKTMTNGAKVTQKNRLLKPESGNIYHVSFDAEELTIELA